MASAPPPDGAVVLLHGLGRSGLSMHPIANMLRRAGYPTLSPCYGHGRTMAGIVAHLTPRIDRFAAAHPGPLHIVTHSLGGLVARAFITAARPAGLGRVVMLSPPNAGSELADFATRLGLGGIILGRVGDHLRTGQPAAVAAELGPVDFDLGIIAGSRRLDPLLAARLLPSPNDGKVAVAATMVDGMRDHLVLPVQHSLMLHNRAVIAQVCAYLASGRFAR
jgi:pimeloyl-ACP methyl ester carboxylesterase